MCLLEIHAIGILLWLVGDGCLVLCFLFFNVS